MMTLIRPLLCLLGALPLACAAQAHTAWDEAVSGDFSNIGTSPTPVTLLPGANLIRGTTGRISGVVDRDYFSFTLPAGWQLDTLTVLPGSTFPGGSGLSFIGVQSGTQVTVNPTGGSAEGLLGWMHFGENHIGEDILQIMGFGPGASGFFGPLPAGSYAFWIQDTVNGTATYELAFGVSVVPEPAAGWMLLAGIGVLAGAGRLRRR